MGDGGITYHGVGFGEIAHQQDRPQNIVDVQCDLDNRDGGHRTDQLRGSAPGDQDIKALVHVLQGQLNPVLQVPRVDHHLDLFIFGRFRDHGISQILVRRNSQYAVFLFHMI